MNKKQKNTLAWLIFIAVAVMIGLIINYYYHKSARRLALAQAENFATQFTSIATVNYLQREVHKAKPITNCTDVLTLASQQLPVGFKIESQMVPKNETRDCRLMTPYHDIAVPFRIIGVD